MISVIVPVLNNEKYIDRCIQSILNQSYQDFELLLMVGKCKDQSLERCISWQKTDDRIIIVSRKDNSLGDARNYALPIAKGEYIAYVDADDWIRRDYLEKLNAPLKEHPGVDVSCCGYRIANNFEEYDSILPKAAGEQDSDFAYYLKVMPIFNVWAKMYRRQWLVANNMKMPDGLSEDVSLYVMVGAVAKKIYFVKEPLYFYNQGNEGSLSNSHFLEPYTSYISVVYDSLPYLRKNNVFPEYKMAFDIWTATCIQNGIFKTEFHPEMVKKANSFVGKTDNAFKKYMCFQSSPTEIHEKVVVFGSGKDAVRLLHQLPHGVRVRYLVDNDAKKAGQSLCGVVIRQFDDLLQEPRDIPVIISTRNYRFEIAKQLDGAGFSHWCYIESVLTQDQLRVPIEELTTPEKET